MAEALVGVLVEQLASLAFEYTFEYTKETVTLVLNAKEDAQKFSRKLKAIQAVLNDAEKRQAIQSVLGDSEDNQQKEASVQNWIDQLNNVSYEMVDVLDEWNTEILKQQVGEKKQEPEGENVLVTKKKVCLPISFNCFHFGVRHVNAAIQHYNIAKKIKELNEKLASINAEREEFGFHLSSIASIDDQLKLLNEQRLKTTNFVDRSAMFGREEAESNLLSKLITESSQNPHRAHVIPIVGMGGIGKTTLAQLAFNNETVKSHFDKRIWVCVSDPFDELKVAKAIIRGTGSNTSDSNELEEVLECMSRSIEGKKVLIVLDDVWTEDRMKWENLKLPIIMQSSVEGSKIIVTTRNVGVATMMGVTTDHMIQIDILSDEVCFALFNSIAFLGREEDESKFGAIGKELVKRCRGLPLAVRSLGKLVQDKKKMREWKEILNSKILDLKGVEKDVFRPLLLSYFDLSPIVKRCLLYCATFPKDYEFDKHMLIELWMSQDYLNRKENTNKEAIGEQIFNNLVMRSFFQDVAEQVDDQFNFMTISCKMHDIIHDLVQFLSKNECCIIEAKDANKRTEVRSESSVRHLTLMSTDESDQDVSSLLSSVNCKMLRTLSTLDSFFTGVDSKLINLQLKCVRTLNLSDNYNIRELPEEIGSLVHLRYLDLSKSRGLKELPASLCNLYNLETLRLVDCLELEKLPEKMGNLINLRHLHIMGCWELKYLPKGIGKLTNLRTLDWCPVTDSGVNFFGSGVNEAFKLGDLGSLDQLQGNLAIIVKEECQLDTSDAENSALRNKKLSSFRITFQRNAEILSKKKRNAEIVNLLRPHEDLEGLGIGGYNGITYPNWMMSLHSLRFLSLWSWSECEFLPPLGKLPCLEKLTVHNVSSVKTVGDEFLGMESSQASSCILFPKLKELCFEYMNEWQQWEGVGGCEESGAEITIMPCLSSFTISECWKLRNLPVFLRKTPVRKISLFKCRRSIIIPVWPENSDVNIQVEYPREDSEEEEGMSPDSEEVEEVPLEDRSLPKHQNYGLTGI